MKVMSIVANMEELWALFHCNTGIAYYVGSTISEQHSRRMQQSWVDRWHKSTFRTYGYL